MVLFSPKALRENAKGPGFMPLFNYPQLNYQFIRKFNKLSIYKKV